MLEIFIFLQTKSINLERKTQHAVITHANTSNGLKIYFFLFCFVLFCLLMLLLLLLLFFFFFVFVVEKVGG